MGETGQCSGIAPDEREAEPGAGFAWKALAGSERVHWQVLRIRGLHSRRRKG